MSHNNSMFGDEAKKYGLDKKDGPSTLRPAQPAGAKAAQPTPRPQQYINGKPYTTTSTPMGQNSPAQPYPRPSAGLGQPAGPQWGLPRGARVPAGWPAPPQPTGYQMPEGGKPKATGLRSTLSALSFIATILGVINIFGLNVMAGLGFCLLGFGSAIVSLVLLRGYRGKIRAVVSLVLSGFFLAMFVYGMLFYSIPYPA